MSLTSEKISSELFSDTAVFQHMKTISEYINDRQCYDGAVYDARGGGDPEYYNRIEKDIKLLKNAVLNSNRSETLKEIYSYSGDQIELGNCNYWSIVSEFLLDVVDLPSQDALEVILEFPSKNALWYYGPYRSHGGATYQAQVFRNLSNILEEIAHPSYVGLVENEMIEIYRSFNYKNNQEDSRVLGDLLAKTLLERLRKDFESEKIKFKNEK